MPVIANYISTINKRKKNKYIQKTDQNAIKFNVGKNSKIDSWAINNSGMKIIIPKRLQMVAKNKRIIEHENLLYTILGFV